MITSQSLLATALEYSGSVTVTPALKETLECAKSFPPQNFFVYHPSLNLFNAKDIPFSFALIDSVEWLITHSMNSYLLHASVINQTFLDEGLAQLARLQFYHCALVETCWKTKIPIWSYEQREAIKIDGKLQYSDKQESIKSIDDLWRAVIALFITNGDPAVTKFINSYALHSWLAKAISRPFGRYLLKKIVKNATTTNKAITIKINKAGLMAGRFGGQDCRYEKDQIDKIFNKRYSSGFSGASILYIPPCENYRYFISEYLLCTVYQEQLKPFYSPMVTALLHELQHIKTGLKGISRGKFPTSVITRQYWSNQEEWHTIRGSATAENTMNIAYSLPERTTHIGYLISQLPSLLAEIKTMVLKDLDYNPHLQS